MRPLLATVLLVLLLSGCTADKYTDTPKATGPWSEANADPDTRDNNIVPLTERDDLP